MDKELQKVTSNMEVQTNSSKSSELTLTKDQKQKLDLKYASPRFGVMADNVLVGSVKLLLLKMAVITGWSLPEGDLLTVLQDQMYKKLKESYSFVNADEIEYAFRNKGTGKETKDYGKNFNLGLLDEVMEIYLSDRAELSEIEHQRKTKQLPPKKELTFEEKEAWIKECKGQLFDAVNLPVYFLIFYDFLEDQLKLTDLQKWDLMKRAVIIRRRQLTEDIPTKEGQNDLRIFNEYAEVEKFKGFPPEELNRLRNLSKKLAIYDYLK